MIMTGGQVKVYVCIDSIASYIRSADFYMMTCIIDNHAAGAI